MSGTHLEKNCFIDTDKINIIEILLLKKESGIFKGYFNSEYSELHDFYLYYRFKMLLLKKNCSLFI